MCVPAPAWVGPFGHSRKTSRSVAMSGMKRTLMLPDTMLDGRSTFTVNVYRGRLGSGAARAGTGGHPGLGAAAAGAAGGAAVVVGVGLELDVVPDCRTRAWLLPPLLHAAETRATARTTATATTSARTPTPKPLQIVELESFVPVRAPDLEIWRGVGGCGGVRTGAMVA